MRQSLVTLNGISKSVAHCRDMVRRLDNPAHLCGYFYPKYAQDDYYALKAWNIELATIKWVCYDLQRLHLTSPIETAQAET